jgi:hypothetical protein
MKGLDGRDLKAADFEQQAKNCSSHHHACDCRMYDMLMKIEWNEKLVEDLTRERVRLMEELWNCRDRFKRIEYLLNKAIEELEDGEAIGDFLELIEDLAHIGSRMVPQQKEQDND